MRIYQTTQMLYNNTKDSFFKSRLGMLKYPSLFTSLPFVPVEELYTGFCDIQEQKKGMYQLRTESTTSKYDIEQSIIDVRSLKDEHLIQYFQAEFDNMFLYGNEYSPGVVSSIRDTQVIRLDKDKLYELRLDLLARKLDSHPDILILSHEFYPFLSEELKKSVSIYIIPDCKDIYALNIGTSGVFSLVNGMKCGLRIISEEDEYSFTTKLYWRGSFKCEGFSVVKVEIR